FLKHVLRLEPLNEPSEEVEVTRRGQAFHRALSRLHRQMRAAGTDAPEENVSVALAERLQEAVDEYARRAPSLAVKELGGLEGQRLQRSAARYGGHWRGFLGPWLEQGVKPKPHDFEVDFGVPAANGAAPVGPLVIRMDGVEVRIGGRIDRVDLAELEGGTG